MIYAFRFIEPTLKDAAHSSLQWTEETIIFRAESDESAVSVTREFLISEPLPNPYSKGDYLWKQARALYRVIRASFGQMYQRTLAMSKTAAIRVISPSSPPRGY